MFQVFLSRLADKQLCKLNRNISRMIYAWINSNLQNCVNPRLHGKALTGNRAGLWRYRVGDYRLIARILDNEHQIQIIEIGHRKDIYD